MAATAPRAYWYVWWGTLINRLGSFVIPLLTIYLTRVRHISVADAGGIIALYGLGSILGSFVGGQLSDHWGRRGTLLASLFGSAIVLFAFGHVRDLTAIAAMVCALGFVGDLYRPAVLAFVADVIPPAERVHAFGLLYWAINLGFAFAIAIGGLVADYDFSILFIADAATTAAFGVIIALAVPETRPARIARAATATAPARTSPWRDREFMVFVGIAFVMILLPMQAGAALAAHMTWQGFSASTYGIVLSVNGFLIILLQPILLGWSAKHDSNRILIASAVLYGIGTFAHGLASIAIAHAAAVALWTIAEILDSSTRSTIVANLSPSDARGRYQGLLVMSWGAAQMVGPPVGTFVWQRFGPMALWTSCLVVGVLTALAFAITAGPRRRRMAAATASS